MPRGQLTCIVNVFVYVTFHKVFLSKNGTFQYGRCYIYFRFVYKMLSMHCLKRKNPPKTKLFPQKRIQQQKRELTTASQAIGQSIRYRSECVIEWCQFSNQILHVALSGAATVKHHPQEHRCICRGKFLVCHMCVFDV